MKPHSACVCLMWPFPTLPFGKGERQKERETDNRSHADLFHSCCSAQWGEAAIEQTTDVFDLQTACVKFSKSEWNGAITSRCVFWVLSVFPLWSCVLLRFKSWKRLLFNTCSFFILNKSKLFSWHSDNSSGRCVWDSEFLVVCKSAPFHVVYLYI